MSDLTCVPTPAPAAVTGGAGTDPSAGQGRIVLGLLAAVVIADQMTKWWGWRHASRAFVNPGGTWFVGRPLDELYSGALTGPLLDVLGLGSWASPRSSSCAAAVGSSCCSREHW